MIRNRLWHYFSSAGVSGWTTFLLPSSSSGSSCPLSWQGGCVPLIFFVRDVNRLNIGAFEHIRDNHKTNLAPAEIDCPVETTFRPRSHIYIVKSHIHCIL